MKDALTQIMLGYLGILDDTASAEAEADDDDATADLGEIVEDDKSGGKFRQ